MRNAQRMLAIFTAIVVFIASVHCVCGDAFAAPAPKAAHHLGHDCCGDTQDRNQQPPMPGHSNDSCHHCGLTAVTNAATQTVGPQQINFHTDWCSFAALTSQYVPQAPCAVANFPSHKPSSTLLALNCALNT
jgi:hypothetical protein